MCKIIGITNRRLCQGDFLRRTEEIAKSGVSALILREKDMPPKEYHELAKEVMRICKKYRTECILHYFTETAFSLGVSAIHLPLPVLRSLRKEERRRFAVLGASCHSVEEALAAQALGCTYITAGHVFETDCKQKAAPRGTEFLKEVCHSVQIPVYGLGGINAGNASLVTAAGAAGVCVMGGLMRCADPVQYIGELKYGCGCPK